MATLMMVEITLYAEKDEAAVLAKLGNDVRVISVDRIDQ